MHHVSGEVAAFASYRFDDLRHTAATRLVSLHIPLPEVGRVLGHTQPVTTYRYVNANVGLRDEQRRLSTRSMQRLALRSWLLTW